MTCNTINDVYFEWLFNLVCGNRYSKHISYEKLLTHLRNKEFRYVIDRDENRAEDGIDLRYRFAYEHAGIEDAEMYISGPCSVLEMMIALAIRCEEDIMDDSSLGNRTAQWFWSMITSLGLGPMTDNRYNERIVEDILEQFLDRNYEPDGRGGLFTIRDCDCDLRTVEIWHQLCWYLDNIT